MEGTLFVCGVEAKTVFDPGSTPSFLSIMFAKLIDVPLANLNLF